MGLTGEIPASLPSPCKENTAAVLVSYLPGPGIAGHLKQVTEQFVQVYQIDNTPRADSAIDFPAAAGLEVKQIGSNIGLAAALNRGCELAHKAGYQWVVTLDQDSELKPTFLNQQIKHWHAAPAGTAMLGCNFTDASRTGALPRHSQDTAIKPCRTVITSGALMSLQAWRDAGTFREEFFIDSVDHELCLRMRAHNFVVARHGEVLMSHTIGAPVNSTLTQPYRHSPLRKYYSTRNGLRTALDHWAREPVWVSRRLLGLAWEAFAVALYGPQRWQILCAMGRGVSDAMGNRMGEETPPQAGS
jgi:rhamnosyltransferase